MAKDIVAEVKFEDAMRDHSIGMLTPEEHQEIALFHSMKQDPYYKHHLRTHLSRYADEISGTTLKTALPSAINPNDFTKFDRINLFDFRRTLQQKPREPKLDDKGKAWGFGKRKSAAAVVNVRAGSGRVMVNGKPMTSYFHMPEQRHKLLTPLVVTSYTCMLDVNIRVWGGGTSGQCEAIIPALSRALQNYDVSTRRPLKNLDMLKTDPRRVERKKPGLIKARKGQVYRRR